GKTMKIIATALGAALLAFTAPASAGGFGHYDIGNAIRYTDHGGDWSVSIRLGDSHRHHVRNDYRRHDRRYWSPYPQRWVPPGQIRKRDRDYGRGFRQGYREGFRDGYAAAPCYEERRDHRGRRVRVELPGWRCR